jgi:hypothetical protein
MIDDEPRLLDTSEVALRLRVSANRVRHISASELPYLQLDARGLRRYRPRDVERYVEARTVRR